MRRSPRWLAIGLVLGVAASSSASAPPSDPPNLDAIRAKLPSALRASRSDSIVLLHQGADPEAESWLRELERVVRAFDAEMARLGVEIDPRADRLVLARLDRRADYLDFLDREGAAAYRLSQGYFHPSDGFVVVAARAGEPAIARQLRELDDAGQRTELDALRAENLRRDLGTAAHEMIHTLVRAAGLAPRVASWPRWLHEGLAMQFEVVRDGVWAGLPPDTPNPTRADVWRGLDPKPRLVPLVRDEGFAVGYQPARYAAAWALVTWLRVEHPDALGALIRSLETPTSRTSAPRRAELWLRDRLGPDLAAAETRWHEFMNRTLRDPSSDK
jgi:hypothetical protein